MGKFWNTVFDFFVRRCKNIFVKQPWRRVLNLLILWNKRFKKWLLSFLWEFLKHWHNYDICSVAKLLQILFIRDEGSWSLA